MVLAYIEAEAASEAHGGLRSGANRRQKGLEPELRLIDIDGKEEISADTLSISRYEGLTSSDYHMCLVPSWKTPMPATQRGALGALGNGLWDATMYPARLFSSGGSIRSTTSSGDKGSTRGPGSLMSKRVTSEEPLSKEVQDIAGTAGTRIFVHSPYDCVAAVKRDLTDRLAWLDIREKYEEAWNLVDEHPEAAGPANEVIDSASETAGKPQSSLGDFFADDRSSVTTTGRAVISAAEQEKRRIGELWIGQLLGDNMWTEAAQICAKVLRTAPRWEHWAWVFIKNDKIDEISPYVPIDIHPSLPSLVYEVILGHYVSRDRSRFKELVDTWPLDLFEASSVITASEEQLKSGVVAESEDWRILMSCIAKLYLADGHYREALHCYIQLQDADTAMNLIRDHRLLDAVSDDIPAFIAIRVSREQLRSAPVSELEQVTAEPIKLLVSEAYTGIVRPQTVVDQLKSADRLIFLYFYLRALWRGEALPADATKPRRGRSALISDAANKLAADEGKAQVEHFADTAIELFADYDRPLLMEFLQISTSYTFETAISICEMRHFTTELIYLLSKMGQTKRALNLILSDLKDVAQAISFAKSQNDPDLWEDLLDYSMDKPQFIHGLLVEAGTSIDPINLVRRIPSGLEIEGLREGLARMIREHDLQASISQGAARVLQSEVAVGMDGLRRGQRRGIKFNIIPDGSSDSATPAEDNKEPTTNTDPKDQENDETPPPPALHESGSGRCGGCLAPFHANGTYLLFPPYSMNKINTNTDATENRERNPNRFRMRPCLSSLPCSGRVRL